MQAQIDSSVGHDNNRLTQEQVSAIARTLKHYIAAAEENGWLLPAKSGTLLNR